MKNNRILAVIPARGGSKEIPLKNIKMLKGKPLIAYTIEAAKQSRILTDCVVSTDNKKIRDIALKFGAEVPFLRPKRLASDKALAIPTIQHAVRAVEKAKNIKYDYVVMLQPTTPLRTARDIDNALLKLIDSDAQGIISIVDVENWHPMKMKKIIDGYLVDYAKPPMENPPRQILPKVYMVNGAIYAAKRDTLMKQNTFKGKRCLGYLMPPQRSVNIDSQIDLLAAGHYLKKINEK